MNFEKIKQLPKVELHCHLDGSIPFETLKILAEKENISDNELKKVFAPKKCHDLNEYLKGFDIILKMLQTAENLEIAIFALIEAVAKENVRYIEIRFAPLLHQQNGLSVQEIIEALTRGISKAQKKYPIYVNLLICAMRHHEPQKNLALLNELKKINNPLIAGFDFAGDEAAFDNQKIAPVVKQAITNNLQITLHSGECGCAQNVAEAIRLGAKRIGHGVAIIKDPEVIKFCQKNKTHLELCPTSNLQTNAITSWDEYPLRKFLELKINCSINTDNRTVSNTSLSREFMLLTEHCQLTLAEMKKLTQNAIDASFASQNIKSELTQIINNLP